MVAVSARSMTVVLAALLLASPFAVSVSAVPEAPSNLAAQVVGDSVILTWTAPGAPVIGYLLEAGSATGLSNVVSSFVGPTPSLTATTVPDGQYFVRVRAVGTDGASEPSNEVIVVVGPAGCSVPPNPPIDLQATTSGAQVMLTWGSGGGCPASHFLLSVGNSPGLGNLLVAGLGSVFSLTTSAPPGVYYVRLFAQNAFGTSNPSNEVIVHVASQPSPLCGVVTATLTPAPYGDPDKALITVRYPATASGTAFLSFTSYRRVGVQWVEYDWRRGQIVLPNGYSTASAFIDKPVGLWRLDFRCDGQLIAQREGSN